MELSLGLDLGNISQSFISDGSGWFGRLLIAGPYGASVSDKRVG